MQDYMLETHNLTKVFGQQKAVDAVSIKVPKAKVYGLLGPNGAGKSTLLKMLCGMILPTSGTMVLDGRPWSRKELGNIGALIENAPLYPNLSAYENCKVRCLTLGIPDERIFEVLETVGLSDTKKKKAGQFSLGMKQRLGIALALLNSPQLLILDEPTNGLDPIAIQELRGLISGFAETGTSVIVSSHILAEVAHIADYIGIISKGKLGFEGPMQKDLNLEELFMDVVKETGGARYV